MTQLFDDLVNGGAPAVRALMGRHETLELDFKQRTSPAHGGDKGTKKVLAKALSAFANSMGGLIVWGVDCRKNADGVDQVESFTPITGLAKFASDMRDWTVEALMPRHSGIRVEALDEGNDTGFLLVDVERSERRPHHCEMGDKGYYRRAGASSRAMEHFEIEDAFRRISAPELVLESQIVTAGSTRNLERYTADIAVHLAVRNISTVTAEHAYIAFGSQYKSAIRDNSVMRNQPPLKYFEVPNTIVHPGTSRTMATVMLPIVMLKHNEVWVLRRSSLIKNFQAYFGCSNITKREQIIAIDEAAVHCCLEPRPVLID